MSEEYPDSWVSLKGGDVSGGSDGELFGNTFVEAPDDAPGSISELSQPISGITVINTEDLIIDRQIDIEDCCVLCANESITVTTDGSINGRGMGGEGGEAITVPASFNSTVSITGDNDIYNDEAAPGWMMNRSRGADGVVRAGTNTTFSTSRTVEDDTNLTDGGYAGENINRNPVKEIAGDVPDVGVGLGSMRRPVGEAGMFGEGDWFASTGKSHREWVEQLYLLTVAKKKLSLEFHEQLRGGRGGEGAIVSGPQLTDATRDDIYDIWERIFGDGDSDGSDTEESLDIADYNGGDGGASLLLMAPKVTVEEGATINLQGTNPTAPAKSVGMVEPGRGRAGRFGVISRDYDIFSGAIKTNAEVSPVAIGSFES